MHALPPTAFTRVAAPCHHRAIWHLLFCLRLARRGSRSAGARPMQKTGPASIRPTPSLTLGTPYIFSAAAVDSATLLYSCALPDHRPADPQIVAQPEEDGVGRLELLEHTPLAAPRPLLGPLRRRTSTMRTVPWRPPRAPVRRRSTGQTPPHQCKTQPRTCAPSARLRGGVGRPRTSRTASIVRRGLSELSRSQNHGPCSGTVITACDKFALRPRVCCTRRRSRRAGWRRGRYPVTPARAAPPARGCPVRCV